MKKSNFKVVQNAKITQLMVANGIDGPGNDSESFRISYTDNLGSYWNAYLDPGDNYMRMMIYNTLLDAFINSFSITLNLGYYSGAKFIVGSVISNNS